MSFLTIQGLHKAFQTQKIFDDIDFTAQQGELVTLLGPSGCGKSTLLRCIAGLTPLDAGTIRLGGREITTTSPQKRGISMVFQSYALFPNMDVAGNVGFGLKMQRVPASELKKRVASMLELVELGDFAKRYPHQLSGGQRQRVALARSLVVNPQLLLLDEPLSALDARIRKHLREQIRKIQREMKLTTLFVTHDQEEALTLSDRIVLMNQGRIEQNGTAKELYENPANSFVAGFMGDYNVLSADQSAALFGRQHRIPIAIRPEAIHLCRTPVEASNKSVTLQGSIEDIRLLGNVIRYQVRTGTVNLAVDTLNDSLPEAAYKAGARVSLVISEASIKALAP